MSLFQIISLLLTISAVFSYLNHRYMRLPASIGLMLIALLFSLGLIGSGALGLRFKQDAVLLVNSIDFDETLLHGMLSFLLFAGALHVDLDALARQKYIITLLATAGVVGSTFMAGVLSWWTFGLLDIHLPLIHCLLFGALISPTDPVAVLSILKKAGVPESLETKIAGESLFNDGVAVVVFLVLLEIAAGGVPVGVKDIALLFLQETAGGVILGLLLGAVAYVMLKSIDQYQVEVLITLALVSGGFSLAEILHVSGPIAMVVAGLLIGNHGRLLAMSAKTREHLDTFWELVDEVLNAVLFVLIGLEVLVLTLNGKYLLAGLLVIPLLLLVRWISVGLPVVLLRNFRTFSPNVVKVLTWGGLRGGISIALALSLPTGAEKEIILTATYCVVTFSILVQGLTIGRLLRR